MGSFLSDHASLSLETLVGWSIVVILRFFGFYAACVPQSAVTSSEFLNLLVKLSMSKPLKRGGWGLRGSEKEKKIGRGKMILKLF